MEKDNKKVEVVPRHTYKKCYFCYGKGCARCKYTGIYVQKFYHIIYKGQCFGVDGIN